MEFAGQRKQATADANGKWMVKLDPMPASTEPRTLVVQSERPDRTRQVADVVVGEVWLASGQSNMHWTFAKGHGVNRNEEELNAARDPLIRQFTVMKIHSATPSRNAAGQWHACTREALLKGGLSGDSALAYFFARELRQNLGVPVGIVNASMGGTPIEVWTSEEAQKQSPQLQALLASCAELLATFERETVAYKERLALWKEAEIKAREEGLSPPVPPNPPSNPTWKLPGYGFNSMIAPLIPFAIRGAIWYQGESNAGTVDRAMLYRQQLPILIADWRTRWGCDLPFAWVQLPNYGGGGVSKEGFVLVREGQLKALKMTGTGMVVAVDIGESKDVHPKNKQEVARRLALWALGDVYGQKVVATSGPLPASHEVRGSEIIVSFTHAEGGLTTNGGELKGFVIAGENRQWKPASALIENDKVIVFNPEVKKPVAIRYAWEADPTCNLFNGAGLPASPFRTDD